MDLAPCPRPGMVVLGGSILGCDSSHYLINTDLNDITESGTYFIHSNCPNKPQGTGYGIFRCSALYIEDASYVLQEFWNSGGVYYSRILWDDTWGAWHSLA